MPIKRLKVRASEMGTYLLSASRFESLAFGLMIDGGVKPVLTFVQLVLLTLVFQFFIALKS